MTAGTIFDKTRTPLTVWFHACWLFATAKDGISAQHLQRVLEISSYQTAWAMLHRLRSALVRPGRDRLSGTVEVDETYIGGEEPGLRGGRQRGKKVLTGIAVEVREPKGIGRCRMAPLDDASGDTLGTFVTENVQPGATVITDGWAAYRAISGKGYQHRPINQKAARAAGDDPDSLLPGVHRVASLCKRWLLGTHQGSVDAAHLPAYLNEFVFRFNRRRAASRGMVFYRVLQLAAGDEPVRYVDLLASKKPRRAKRAEGGTGHPPSLERPAADRPWRTAEIQLQFPVRLSGSRLSEPVETGAYYVVSEMLANAAKHARASVVEVSAVTSGGTLRVRVRDDGIGGADPVRGSGLLGLKDRIEALGGTFSVHSPVGRGTTVTCELPVTAGGGYLSRDTSGQDRRGC